MYVNFLREHVYFRRRANRCDSRSDGAGIDAARCWSSGRQWFSLPVGSDDWTGNRLWTVPVAIDFPDGSKILFQETALTESPRGRLADTPSLKALSHPWMVQWPGANSPEPARRRGQPHLPPRDRVRYRAHCAELTPSPCSRCGCRHGLGRVARMVQENSLQAAGPPRVAETAAQAGVGWRSIGRSPTAISLKNNSGGHRRGRPRLVGRAMTRTDNAAALFFRAVARDRHPTPACAASRTRHGYEKHSLDDEGRPQAANDLCGATLR